MTTNTLFDQRELLEQLLSGFPQILTNAHIEEITNWSKNTIYAYTCAGKFPEPLPKLGKIKRYAKSSFIDFWLSTNQEPIVVQSKKVGRPTIAEKIKSSRK